VQEAREKADEIATKTEQVRPANAASPFPLPPVVVGFGAALSWHAAHHLYVLVIVVLARYRNSWPIVCSSKPAARAYFLQMPAFTEQQE